MSLELENDKEKENESPVTVPFDPDWTHFPTRKQLPRLPGAPEGAAWVWGENDNVGQSA